MNSLFLNKFNFCEILHKLTSSTKLVVAYSGGVDSQVLLHLLHESKLLYSKQLGISAVEITAIHIDHGLSDNAGAWSDHCLKFCETMRIPCYISRVEVKSKLTNKHSKEALARDLRYAALAELLPEEAVLLTAHHACDQAETLLLQLFRGAGPKGLASIPEKIHFAKKSELIRPLLKFSREEILRYAKVHNLQWVEDESNLDVNIDRNYIRLNLFPLILKHWQGAVKTLGRVAENCAESSELLDDLANQDIKNIRGSLLNTLSIAKLIALSSSRQRNVIRYWLRKQNLSIPSSVKLIEIQKTSLHCSSDRNPVIYWQGAEVRRYQDNLYAMPPLKKHDIRLVIPWDLKVPLELPFGLGFLKSLGSNDELVKIDMNKITVRFRQGGEKILVSGRGDHYHLLKKLFQEWRIPPWQRSRIPLIYFADELVCVAGFVNAKGWDSLVIKHY